jgi:hypothetical protein
MDFHRTPTTVSQRRPTGYTTPPALTACAYPSSSHSELYFNRAMRPAHPFLSALPTTDGASATLQRSTSRTVFTHGPINVPSNCPRLLGAIRMLLRATGTLGSARATIAGTARPARCTAAGSRPAVCRAPIAPSLATSIPPPLVAPSPPISSLECAWAWAGSRLYAVPSHDSLQSVSPSRSQPLLLLQCPFRAQLLLHTFCRLCSR